LSNGSTAIAGLPLGAGSLGQRYQMPPANTRASRAASAGTAQRHARAAATGRRGAVEGHTERLNRLGDVLDPVLAHRLERQRELVAHLVINAPGDADAPRLGEALKARGDVHAVAVDVALLQHDVADVDADAEPDAPVFGLARLALRHAVLDRDRALDRVDGAGELDQGAVARELDHAAAVLIDQRLDEVLAVGPKPRMRRGFVLAHQPAVADHVRRKYGSQSAFNPRGHRQCFPLWAAGQSSRAEFTVDRPGCRPKLRRDGPAPRDESRSARCASRAVRETTLKYARASLGSWCPRPDSNQHGLAANRF
jgi:hypothetical protein